MSWNNRIIRHFKNGEVTYALHEVHYDDDGNIKSWSSDPVTGHWETLEDLGTDLEQKLNDVNRFKSQIIDFKDLPGSSTITDKIKE